MIAGIRPTIAVSDFVRRVKSEAAGAIKRKFRRLGCFDWQDTFSAFSLNAFDYDEAVDYVKDQQEHHRNNTLIEIWEQVVGGVDAA